ncbi:MAG TPA: GAF domain-containing protein, partial [Roseiflexaceae bacterium]|nr:GAF domain-containing protein [Roseiflexaceae bacterium]
MLLQHDVGGPVRESWGLDDNQLQQLLARNGHRTPETTIELPLEHAGASAGVLLLGNPADGSVFAPGLLEALRRQLELLITLQRKVVAHQQQLVKLDTASSLSADLFATTDLREALRSLIERAVVLSGAQCGAIYTVADDGYLELMISHGLLHDYTGTRLAPGQGLSGRVVQERAVILLDDYQTYEDRLPQFADETFHAYIGVPLLVQDELIGVLSLMHNRPQAHFSDDDRVLIETFAKSAALVVRNAQLFAQQQQRARELFVLYENGKVIGSTLQIEPMLTRVAENITLAMGADRCVIQLIDDADPPMLTEAASYSADGSADAPIARLRLDAHRPIAKLLRSSETLVLD